MTNEQQFQLTVWLVGGVVTAAATLLGVIFNGFRRTQDDHSKQLNIHEKELAKLKEAQYLKIESLEKRVDELKDEVHELRKEIQTKINKENEVLNSMLSAMQRMEQTLKQIN